MRDIQHVLHAVSPLVCHPKVDLLQILDGQILMYGLYRLIADLLLSSCKKPYNQV